MNCPRCQEELESKLLKSVNSEIEVDECPNGHGQWFDFGELKKVEEMVEPSLVEIKRIPSEKNQMKDLRCPSCNSKEILIKAKHHRDQSVILDYCGNCSGVWVDKGELKAIQKINIFTFLGTLFKWLSDN